MKENLVFLYVCDMSSISLHMLEVKMLNNCFTKAKAIQVMVVNRIVLVLIISTLSHIPMEQASFVSIYTVQTHRLPFNIKHGLQTTDYV